MKEVKDSKIKELSIEDVQEVAGGMIWGNRRESSNVWQVQTFQGHQYLDNSAIGMCAPIGIFGYYN